MSLRSTRRHGPRHRAVIPVEQARSFAERLRSISHSVVSYVEPAGAGDAFDMTNGARTGSMATAPACSSTRFTETGR
jgi:hypothetical protein